MSVFPKLKKASSVSLCCPWQLSRTTHGCIIGCLHWVYHLDLNYPLLLLDYKHYRKSFKIINKVKLMKNKVKLMKVRSSTNHNLGEKASLKNLIFSSHNLIASISVFHCNIKCSALCICHCFWNYKGFSCCS